MVVLVAVCVGVVVGGGCASGRLVVGLVLIFAVAGWCGVEGVTDAYQAGNSSGDEGLEWEGD